MTFATDYQPGDAYERFLNGMAVMDRQLDHSGMKRSLTPADVRSAPYEQLSKQSKARTSFKATLSVSKKPTGAVYGTSDCFTTAMIPCH
jgi:hypothetical protein